MTRSSPLRAEHREQMMARDVFTFDLSPLHENIFCEPYRIPDISFNQGPTGIVIGPFPILLKLPKSSNDIEQFLFNCCRILLIFGVYAAFRIGPWLNILPSRAR